MRAIRWLGSGSALILLAVLLGIATAGATLTWLQSQQSTAVVASSESKTRGVVVALEDIPAGTKLPGAALTVRAVAEKDALAGAHGAADEVVGRVTRYPVIAGEQVTDSKLVGSAQAKTGLAYTLAAGQRAVSVSVSETTAAGGLIVPGDRVDVMVATTQERVTGPVARTAANADNDAGKEPTVVTVLQNVLVLAVGQELTPPADKNGDPATQRNDKTDPQPRARSITLSVSPDQSQTLFMASHQGPLGFAVRSFGDASQQTLTPVARVLPAAVVPTERLNRVP